MRILLGEDECGVRAALRLSLELQSDSNTIIETAELNDLLVQAKESNPDLILLDWELGSKGMADAVSVLKCFCPATKIIALSCRTESSKKALAAGVDAFISKSDHPEKLLKAIEYFQKKMSGVSSS